MKFEKVQNTQMFTLFIVCESVGMLCLTHNVTDKKNKLLTQISAFELLP